MSEKVVSTEGLLIALHTDHKLQMYKELSGGPKKCWAYKTLKAAVRGRELEHDDHKKVYIRRIAKNSAKDNIW